MAPPVEFSLDDVLPHRPPMRLVDSARRAGPSAIESEWASPPGFRWSDGHVVHRVALLEFAAQTAAAWSGLSRLDRGLAPVPGYLGGVDGFTFEGDAAPGETLRCRMDVRFRMGDTVRVACAVSGANGRILARGEMSLALALDAPAERV